MTLVCINQEGNLEVWSDEFQFGYWLIEQGEKIEPIWFFDDDPSYYNRIVLGEL